jgi:hypothetical protein
MRRNLGELTDIVRLAHDLGFVLSIKESFNGRLRAQPLPCRRLKTGEDKRDSMENDQAEQRRNHEQRGKRGSVRLGGLIKTVHIQAVRRKRLSRIDSRGFDNQFIEQEA